MERKILGLSYETATSEQIKEKIDYLNKLLKAGKIRKDIYDYSINVLNDWIKGKNLNTGITKIKTEPDKQNTKITNKQKNKFMNELIVKKQIEKIYKETIRFYDFYYQFSDDDNVIFGDGQIIIITTKTFSGIDINNPDKRYLSIISKDDKNKETFTLNLKQLHLQYKKLREKIISIKRKKLIVVSFKGYFIYASIFDFIPKLDLDFIFEVYEKAGKGFIIKAFSETYPITIIFKTIDFDVLENEYDIKSIPELFDNGNNDYEILKFFTGKIPKKLFWTEYYKMNDKLVLKGISKDSKNVGIMITFPYDKYPIDDIDEISVKIDILKHKYEYVGKVNLSDILELRTYIFPYVDDYPTYSYMYYDVKNNLFFASNGYIIRFIPSLNKYSTNLILHSYILNFAKYFETAEIYTDGKNNYKISFGDVDFYYSPNTEKPNIDLFYLKEPIECLTFELTKSDIKGKVNVYLDEENNKLISKESITYFKIPVTIKKEKLPDDYDAMIPYKIENENLKISFSFETLSLLNADKIKLYVTDSKKIYLKIIE